MQFLLKRRKKSCVSGMVSFQYKQSHSTFTVQAQLETGPHLSLQAEPCECRNSQSAKLCLIRAVRIVNPKY